MKSWSEHPRALAILKSDSCGRYTMSYLRQNNFKAAVFLAPLLLTISVLAQTPSPTVNQPGAIKERITRGR
jgi:hypothetical protein